VYRLYESLFAAIVTKRLSCGHDAARNRRIRDKPTVPYRIDDFAFRHDPVTLLNEQSQQFEYLRLAWDHHACPAQLPAFLVILEVIEGVQHCVSL